MLGTAALTLCGSFLAITDCCASPQQNLELLRPRFATVQQLKVEWRGVPLVTGIERLNRETQSCFFLDRRIDPQQPIALESTGTPPELLAELAASNPQLGVCQVGSIGYLGPPKITKEFGTLVLRAFQRVGELPRADRERLLSSQPVRWKRASQAEEVVVRMLAEHHFEIVNPDAIPHDLWAAGQLPAAPLAMQLTTLLIGFDLDWRPAGSGRSIELILIERPVDVSATYLLASQSRRRLGRLSAELKQITRVRGNRLLVTGSAQQHLKITEELGLIERRNSREGLTTRKQTQPSQPNIESQRVTLTVEQQPLGLLLEKIATSFGLQLRGPVVDQQQKEKYFSQRVSFAVKQVTLAELLTTIARETDSEITVAGQTVTISIR